MIILPPYAYDYVLIDQIDPADRWIFNKLELATRLGHDCGPENVVPSFGDYCVRPEMSLHGMGTGGFFKVHTDNWMQEPGYFWCEWFNGPHHWVQYINDVAKSYSTGVMNNTDRLECEESPVAQAPAIHPVLQNFSRYMLVEFIGDKIIEAAPRFMVGNAQHRFVADYRSINPRYKPEDDVTIKYGMTNMKRVPITINGHDGYTWGDSDRVDYNRRPFAPTPP